MSKSAAEWCEECDAPAVVFDGFDAFQVHLCDATRQEIDLLIAAIEDVTEHIR